MNCTIQRFLFGLSGIWLIIACFSYAGVCRAAELSVAKSVTQDEAEKTVVDRKEKKWVFLNASKNRDGNTSKLAQITLKGFPYKSINLVDFHIDQVGQQSKNDEYLKVIDQLSGADVLIIGTPVYWSDMSGYLKTFIDRLSDIMEKPLNSAQAPLNGADVYLIVQGTEPSDAIPGITTVIEHICRRFFMNYKGIILKSNDAVSVNKSLRGSVEGR